MNDHRPEPAAPYDPTRRELLTRWGAPVLAGAALAGLGAGLAGRPGRHRPPAPDVTSVPPDWRVRPAEPGRVFIAGGEGPRANVARAVAAMGGMATFVQPGERVVIKPNCAWDRTAAQAANTDPEVVAELVRLCLEAGASAVVVADSSVHDPVRVFARSGIADAARTAGAAVAHPKNTGTVRLDLGGAALGTWEVLRPLVEADRVINAPVVKHHSLGRATLGMKNWFGALVGPRGGLHQRLNQVCAELGVAFRPTLTVIDATRVLTGGGPTGGSLALVRPDDLVAVATDPVAADAWGAGLLGLGPDELPYLAMASSRHLGTTDWQSVATTV